MSNMNPRFSRRKSAAPPTQEQVRRRAYEIFEERRGGPGDALSDWLRAEQELGGAPAAPSP